MDLPLAAGDADHRPAAGAFEKHKVLALAKALLPRSIVAELLAEESVEKLIFGLTLGSVPGKCARESIAQAEKAEQHEHAAKEAAEQNGEKYPTY